ncbi:MAG: nucleotidyltransferase domain-containing protein [Clostridia bacterium]|nr:nucleotidyltransferase domain-containing protein [Clostridia bacterium]
MIDIDKYLNDLLSECKNVFGGRLLYMGLQGSYMRGEANENSDIDIMVIIDGFTVSDMDAYRRILSQIGNFDKSCGFICGKDEIRSWNPLEVLQLLHTTKDVYGTLSDYLPKARREDEINYTKISLGNLYHELCHRYIHADREKNIIKFRGTCKSLFFLIQNLHYLQSGEFIITKRELKGSVCIEDCVVLEVTELSDGYDFDRAFSAVFDWCQNAFKRIDMLK